MRFNQLSVAVLVFAAASVASAQQSIRLRVEVFQNEALVSSPEIVVTPGQAATLDVPKIGPLTLTPTLRNSESVRLALDFRACGRHAQPSVVMRANNAGSASWSCAGETLKFRVRWVP